MAFCQSPEAYDEAYEDFYESLENWIRDWKQTDSSSEITLQTVMSVLMFLGTVGCKLFTTTLAGEKTNS